MRLARVLVVLLLVLGIDAAPGPTAPPAGAPLMGAWNGQWLASPDGARGAVDLVVARAPAGPGVVGQFTFLIGGVARTLRYEGRLEEGVLRFPLVGDGHIVLRPRPAPDPGRAGTLQGEWVDPRGVLPAPEGTLRLGRAPVR